MEFNYARVSSNLKKALKLKNMTYTDLGVKIGMTESGVKKLLASHDCSINRLAEISHALDVPLQDLIESSSHLKVVNHTYTKEQEHFFSNNENYFLFYWELRNFHYDTEKIKSSYGLNQKSIEQYLLKLDAIGVIELHENNKIKPLIDPADRGNWDGSSPFARKMINSLKEGLFQHSLNLLSSGTHTKEDITHQMNIMSLKDETFKELNRELKDLIRKYTQKSHKENMLNPQENLVKIGTLSIAVPFKFENALSIPNIL